MKLRTLINTPDFIVSFAVKNVILVIYQTREEVFHQDIRTPTKDLKRKRCGVFLMKFEVFG